MGVLGQNILACIVEKKTDFWTSGKTKPDLSRSLTLISMIYKKEFHTWTYTK